MFTGVYQSVAILAVFILFYAIDVWLMRRYDPQRDHGSSRNWVYTAMLVFAGIIMILQPAIWPRLGLYTSAWWGLLIQMGGLTMLVGALALHGWARMHLGQFYAERSSDIQQGQYVVNTGPYAYVRHPIYTSYFMLATGLLLINPALTALLLAIYAFVDFSLAPRREEKLLVKNVPGYADYMVRTPRFFPRLSGAKRVEHSRHSNSEEKKEEQTPGFAHVSQTGQPPVTAEEW
jgi:protein-S-isoprenylcysteine O-methyltransferase Ste14